MSEELYSRKDFFRRGFAGAVDGLAGLWRRPRAAPAPPAPSRTDRPHPGRALPGLPAWVVRPPGALSEPDFLAACTRCAECLEACPHGVIRKAGPEQSERVEGTPIVVPGEAPCVLCEGLPCVAACEPGALVSPAPGASAPGDATGG